MIFMTPMFLAEVKSVGHKAAKVDVKGLLLSEDEAAWSGVTNKGERGERMRTVHPVA